LQARLQDAEKALKQARDRASQVKHSTKSFSLILDGSRRNYGNNSCVFLEAATANYVKKPQTVPVFINQPGNHMRELSREH